LQDRDDGPRRRAAQHRRLLPGRRTALPGRGDRLHQGTPAVRDADRRLPGDAIHARRHGDRAPGCPLPALRRGGQGHRQRPRQDQVRGDGHAPRARHRLLGGRPGAAASRRLWLSDGLSGRALLARPPRPLDPRGHQPDHARDRQPGHASPVTNDVLITTEQRVGRLRLNRPKAIHALTTQMCDAMSEALLRWRDDDSVEAIIIDHAEGRGFCAGGDVVMLARSGNTDSEDAKKFFFAEYRLNHLLFTYPKPTVAIMDGITMGGGVGISLPSDYRIATENTRLGWPQTGTRLFPEAGRGWWLPRLPGRVGEFMALTGRRLDGAECHYLVLATHYVEQAATDELVERILKTPARVQGAIGALSA